MKVPHSPEGQEDWPVLRRLSQRLANYRRRRIQGVVIHSFVEALCVQLLVLPVLGWISAKQPYETFWLKCILASYVVYLWPFLRGGHAAIRRSLKPGQLAEDLDRANPDSPDIFRTLLSLPNHSPATLTALDRFFASWQAEGKGERPLRIPRATWVGGWRGSGLVLAVGFWGLLPLFSHHYGLVMDRMAFPVSALEHIPVPKLELLSLPQRVVLGDTLHVALRVRNLPSLEPVYASVRFHGQEERYPLERKGDTAWFQDGPVVGDLALRFSALHVETSEYDVQVVPPPSLRSFSAVVQAPSYTHLPPQSLSEVPAEMTALPGSRIVWQGSSAQPLRKLEVIVKASDSSEAASAFDTLNLGSGGNFSFEFPFRSPHLGLGSEERSGKGSGEKSLEKIGPEKVVNRLPLEFRLRLFTTDGLVGNAGPYQVEKGIDAAPEITILSPMDNSELGRSLKLPMVFHAQDDFGISRVTLHYSVRDGEKVLSQGTQDVLSWLRTASGVGDGLWDIGELPIRPGNVLEVYLEAADNDIVSGPNLARSETLHLHMASLEEVVAGMDASEQGALTSLKSAAEREEQVRSHSQQMASEAPANAPPPLSPWEVRRILNSAPQNQLQQLERHLAIEAKQMSPQSPLGKQVESLQRETKDMERRLPPEDAWQKPLDEQKRWLDTLMGDQQTLDEDLSRLKAPPSAASKDSPSQEETLQERKALKDELQRNRQEQKDLHSWMQDQGQQMEAQKQNLEQSQQAEQRAREDIQQALTQMKQTLQKGMENGALSPELLEKMQRIQELLKEALPDSTLDRLKQQAENQQVGVEDLQRSLKDLLDQKKDASEGLDRAIRMLELLRDMHALENLSKDLHQLQSQQERLSDQMGVHAAASPADQTSNQTSDPNKKSADSSLSPEKLRLAQSALRQRLEENQQELARLAQDQKAFRELKNAPQAPEAEEKMRAAENALKPGSPNTPNSPNRDQAQKSAKSAAAELKQMMVSMDNLLGRMQGGPDASEVATVLDETLEFGRWLELIRDKNARVREGWVEEDAALNQRADGLAHWLRGRMEALALRRPFESEVLRREAADMSFQADALLTIDTLNTPYPYPASDSLLVHTRKAARELLKWLQYVMADEGGGGGTGSSEGMGDQSGKGKGQGQGQGQGDGEDEGLDDLAGRMRGVSGKQMAVNQATYQLLKSMLEGRHPGAGSEGGEMPLPGMGERSLQMPGDGSQPGQENSGSSSGSPGSSGSKESGSSPGGEAANAQQGIGESLEKMAESASDAGGAARKLRQLAEEARDLEKDLREGRLDPDEMRQKQERFQTRLLEATNALEEKGQDRQRQAEAYRGGPLKPDSTTVSARDDVFQELRRKEEWARGLSLPAEQKSRIESYYETLLTH